MAVRALNAVADASPVEFRVADLRYAQAMPARKRRLLRVAAGLTTAELNALVGSAGRSVHFWEQGTTPTGEAGAKYGAWLREVASR
jgi:DNA-binding transcriptional regulator YiaG